MTTNTSGGLLFAHAQDVLTRYRSSYNKGLLTSEDAKAIVYLSMLVEQLQVVLTPISQMVVGVTPKWLQDQSLTESSVSADSTSEPDRNSPTYEDSKTLAAKFDSYSKDLMPLLHRSMCLENAKVEPFHKNRKPYFRVVLTEDEFNYEFPVDFDKTMSVGSCAEVVYQLGRLRTLITFDPKASAPRPSFYNEM